nr:hypothetical protein [Euryarchaeota archaeon]
MPACRHCHSTYPREYFIHGIGPRKDVCVRCGVDKGLVEESDVPTLYPSKLANARIALRARRYSGFLWVGLLWILWITFFGSVPTWGLISGIALLLITLALPAKFILGYAKYQATLAKLTPTYERPKGH